MNIKAVLSLIIGILILFAFTGCEESSVNSNDSGIAGKSSASTAQARMIAIENRKLRDKLETQKALLAECQEEKANMETKNAELATQLMEAISEMAKNVDRLQAENNAMREELKQLKSNQ